MGRSPSGTCARILRVDTWLQDAAGELVALKGTSAGWSYRPGAEPYTEPSVMATLALAGTSGPGSGLAATGRWLAGIQNADGSVGLAESLPEPTWPTALATLAWAALGDFATERQQATAYLLGFAGAHWKKAPNDPVGHDTSIRGWPWVGGTHSWVETTALAILALRREGHASHERVQTGLRLLRDRALPGGGWNYGNTTVYGRVLRPHPGPTGLALLALAGRPARDPPVDRALAYLGAELPGIRAPESLCWGLLGLTAWKARPAAADTWLAASYKHLRTGGSRATQLAHLLLAARADANRIFGLSLS